MLPDSESTDNVPHDIQEACTAQDELEEDRDNVGKNNNLQVEIDENQINQIRIFTPTEMRTEKLLMAAN